jgi:hypothetical protein
MGVSPELERSERRAGRRSSMQRGRIVAIVVGVVLLVLLVWWLTSRSSDSEGGSLASKGGGSMSVPVSVGGPVSVGMLELSNDGGSEIVIDRVALVDPTTGMRIVGMYAQPAGQAELGFSGGFRWPRGASEVEGLALKPDGAAGYRLVIGVQVDAQGIFRSPGIQVAYHSGDTAHTTAFQLSMTFCAPPRLYRARCAESS